MVHPTDEPREEEAPRGRPGEGRSEDEPSREAFSSEPSAEEGFGIDSNLVAAVLDAIARDDTDTILTLIEPLHEADIADLIQLLRSDSRRLFLRAIPPTRLAIVVAELDEKVREEVIGGLGPAETAQVLAELETDDAVHIIAELDEADQAQVLEAFAPADRALIEEGLGYPDYSAGRLMRRELVAVPSFWTVGDTLDFLREAADDEESPVPADFYDIFVVDPGHRPIGSVPLSRLVMARRPVGVTEIMDVEMRVIRVDTDQEDVAFLFRQRDLTSAPVVDPGGRLVGVITIDDVVDVIDEEFEDDIMHLGGVSEDDLYSATLDTARLRFEWLFVNLGTALLASVVIGLFEDTIDRFIALAVLLPIVASMGGNAGTQSLTVAVRALATRELSTATARRFVGKEVAVGALNGLAFAVIGGGVTWLWFGDGLLALVLGGAMVTNLIVAALAGTAVPMLLERVGVDPAVASSVFVTTVTDVIGFLSFLGLAALILL